MRSVSTHQPLMGTAVELLIDGDPDALAFAEASMIAEITRLEHVYSAYDPSSELHRWRTDDTCVPSDELLALLALAARWQARSRGAYNPAVGLISAAWAQAASSGGPPTDAELGSLVAQVGSPRFVVIDDHVTRIGDCATLNFNAIAKGLVVDRAAAVGLAIEGIDAVTVNAGGDLVHRGAGAITVGIEDPLSPFDNAPPIAAITICDEGLATSGGSRRGFDIAGRWFSHVIDPRTGRPVGHVLSATVVAPDAVTADVVATIASVLDPLETIAIVEALAGVSCFIVDHTGAMTHNASWAARVGDC